MWAAFQDPPRAVYLRLSCYRSLDVKTGSQYLQGIDVAGVCDVSGDAHTGGLCGIRPAG